MYCSTDQVSDKNVLFVWLGLVKGEKVHFNHYTPTITVVPTLKPPLVFDYFVTLNKEFMFINIDSC